jgi:hypothetical protein
MHKCEEWSIQEMYTLLDYQTTPHIPPNDNLWTLFQHRNEP